MYLIWWYRWSKGNSMDQYYSLKAAADAWCHMDVRKGDVVCWPTNLGWMMGPWLVYASLLNGASMVCILDPLLGLALPSLYRNKLILLFKFSVLFIAFVSCEVWTIIILTLTGRHSKFSYYFCRKTSIFLEDYILLLFLFYFYISMNSCKQVKTVFSSKI